jgi:hypothetical protein
VSSTIFFFSWIFPQKGLPVYFLYTGLGTHLHEIVFIQQDIEGRLVRAIRKGNVPSESL